MFVNRATYLPTDVGCYALATFEMLGQWYAVIELEDYLVVCLDDVAIHAEAIETEGEWAMVKLKPGERFIDSTGLVYKVMAIAAARDGQSVYIGYNAQTHACVAQPSEFISKVSAVF